jgi:hypothetical protein
LATPKNPNDFWKVAQPDFIPEGEEYLHPHKGGIFCDYIPEKATCEDVRPTAEYDENALAAALETLLIEPDEKKAKKNA